MVASRLVGIQTVCRDGSTTYAEAIRTALPDAVQVSDRWRLCKNLCDKVLVETRGHAPCWATCNPALPGGVREQTTLERWHKVHNLLGQGVGLLECSRRLNLALNTVKRYARRPQPPAERIVPRYRPTLVDPHRDHLRTRREQDPAVPVTQLFREIKEHGYTGGLNLLYRYLSQGRAEGPRPVTTPQRAARLLPRPSTASTPASVAAPNPPPSPWKPSAVTSPKSDASADSASALSRAGASTAAQPTARKASRGARMERVVKAPPP
ncbi:hypothetical protein EDD99_5588 [Streptomyces sp. 846.5]|nr:hypothetical protein EDD99_5588 [Streptomyces sp. 846.5]